MADPFALTKPALALLVMLLIMAVSPLLVEPAYIGYLVAYGVLLVLVAPALLTRSHGPGLRTPPLIAWGVFGTGVAAVTIFANPALRDLFRDSGAVVSFLIGLLLIPRAMGRDWERPLFAALSALALIVAVWTILGAARAYLAGAGAYEWRGVYVPFVHTWLPYLIVAEYLRSRMPGSKPEVSAIRIGICILALLLSLSRTGLVQLAVFIPMVVLINARRWLFNPRGVLLAILAVGVAILVFPYLGGLDVVQQRINAGIDDGDLSLAWRDMEVRAARDYLDDGGWFRWLFGYGLGARVPLPWGIVDFNDNIAIPQLHNSYWTLTVKFGVLGLLWILAAIAVTFVRAHSVRAGPSALRSGGSWMLLMVMLIAYTLQGMSEWSHLLFLGLSCALLCKAGDRRILPLRLPSRSTRAAPLRIGERSGIRP